MRRGRGTFCGNVPGLAIVDPSPPERRLSPAQLVSSHDSCPGLLVAVGRLPCGAVDDVWRERVDNQSWQELVPARRAGSAHVQTRRRLPALV